MTRAPVGVQDVSGHVKPSGSLEGLQPIESGLLDSPTGFNIDNAVEGLNSRALCGSDSKCGKFVRLALEDGGIDTSTALNARELTHAYKYDKFLSDQGFSKIGQNTLNSYTPKTGDIMVFGRTSNHLSGHIQMFNGTNWVSDFVQQTPYPWSDYGRYSIFRW
mgnify:CR=1 FL=1